jgi:myosin heavy subunit
VGILSCLEEECVAPRGSDQRFLQKLNKFCNNDDPDAKYKTTRFQDGFILKHYAGDVEYSVNGWIEKNKYPLNEDITRLLARSSQKHTAKLFEEYEEENNDRTHNHSTSSFVSMLKVRKGSGSFGTVGQRHKQQLSTLMSTLYVTHPHFVRCILPNDKKRPGEIQTKLVLDQLRCNGVLEGIRICRKGFPNRLSFDEFRKRYGILCPNLLNRESFIDGRTACQLLLDQLNLDKERYQIGMTKVFFKATVLAELEEQRDNKLGVCITQFQAHCRARLARQFQTRFSRQADAIRVMQRNARIYISLREWPWWKVYAKLKPLNAAYRVDIQMQERDQKIHTLEAQLKDQSSTANEMASRNQELENQQVELKQLILDEQSIIRELEESKQELFQKFTMAEERIEELESELNQKSKTMEENQKNLEQKADQANLELLQQLEENKTLKERLAVLEKENKDIKASLKEKQYQFDKETIEKNGKIQQLELDYKNKLDILNTEIEELKEQLNEVNSQSARDNKQNHETTVQLESEINELKQALNNETDTRNDLQTKYDCLKEDWDNLTALVKAESDQAKSRISR